MAEYEAKAVVIDRPVEDVWRFMLDISNMPRWEDGGAEWRQTSEGPINVGTTFQYSVPILGRHLVGHHIVVEFDPHRKFTVEAIDGFGRGTRISYVMESVEGGKTRLRRLTNVEFHGLAKLLRPFQAMAVKRAGRIEAENVKHLLEGQPDYSREDILKR